MITHPASTRADRIQQRLASLNPVHCQLDDDSIKHAGHAGAASGGGYFRLTIVSEKFTGLRLIERHRLVYDAIGELMQTDIHALTISALTPQESGVRNQESDR